MIHDWIKLVQPDFQNVEFIKKTKAINDHKAKNSVLIDMKVSCILCSFNRPKLIRQSLASIAAQTHKDYQLIVLDESTTFDIRSVVNEFKFTQVEVVQYVITPEVRRSQNRLSVKTNEGLRRAHGDLICYLCDDDFYHPDWFANAADFFVKTPSVHCGFGKLSFTSLQEMTFPEGGWIRWWDEVIVDPFGRLDQNQIIHRPLCPPIFWTEDPLLRGGPDAYFMREVGRRHPFYPINFMAGVKREHERAMQKTLGEHASGAVERSRED